MKIFVENLNTVSPNEQQEHFQKIFDDVCINNFR
jgi:hypothetical protein